METESALFQLMGDMNGIMNGITNSDWEYQEIIRKTDEYSADWKTEPTGRSPVAY